MKTAETSPGPNGLRGTLGHHFSQHCGLRLASLPVRAPRFTRIRIVDRLLQGSLFQMQCLGNTLRLAGVTGFLAISATAAGTPGTADPDRVAILLREPVLKALAGPLNTYIRDVEQRFPVKLQTFSRDWSTAEEVRASIKEMHDKQKISGVILVGAMPMHRFYMHDFANPNPLYYEDFDLRFMDRNGDGVADSYQGEPHLKIWVANLRSSVHPTDDDVATLKMFFAKTHDHYQASEAIEPRALALSGSDWPDGGSWFKEQIAGKLIPKDAITVVENEACTLKSAGKALGRQNHTLTYIQVHSDWNAQSTEDGDLTAEQVAGFRTGSLITINHGCSTGNWMHNEAEKTGPNMAMSYVFGRNIGQVVIAQVRTGMIYDQECLYEGLAAGDCMGKAYLRAKQQAELRFLKGDHVPGDIVSGILMIGNPFVRIGPAGRR